MSDWLTVLHELNRRGEAAVLVTVMRTRGSTPREPGAKMVVAGGGLYDTIGGGQIEHGATESARLLLESGEEYENVTERHKLDPELGQCCGGVATLLLERIPGRPQSWLEELVEARRDRSPALLATRLDGDEKHVLRLPGAAAAGSPADALRALVARAAESGKPVFDRDAGWFVDTVPVVDFNVMLFGAGHVGTALAGVLQALPCNLTWVDSLEGRFPDAVPANVRTAKVQLPESMVRECPPDAFYLIVTHSHPVDLAICEQVLLRGDFAYCGLIGSRSKRRNFEKRLKLKGVTQAALNRLTCPIGIEGISGKRPAEIAVATAAQVLRIREAMLNRGAESSSSTGS